MKFVSYIFIVVFCIESLFSDGQVILELKKDSKNITMPCIINGYVTEFSLDSVSSCVVISRALHQYMLNNGYITPKDVYEKNNNLELEDNCYNGENVLLKKIEIGGLVLKNVVAIIRADLNVPILLPIKEIYKLGEVNVNDSCFIIFDNHNINRINALQKLSYSILKNRTSRSLNLITKNNNYDKASFLLRKVNDNQKNKMFISYNVAKSIILTNECNDSNRTDCNYIQLQKTYTSLKEKYAGIKKHDLFIFRNNNVYKNEVVNYNWVKKRYDLYEKYYAQRAFEILIKVGNPDCNIIKDLLENATKNEDYKQIPITYNICKILFMELCDNDLNIICQQYFEIDSIIKGKSIEDSRIFKANDINIVSFVKNRIDSLCTRRTVLAIKEIEKNYKKNDFSSVLRYLKEAGINNDSSYIQKTYLTTWAKYYQLENDTVNYCFYSQLAKSMDPLNQEDSCLFERYNKIIKNDKECDKFYIRKMADKCYIKMCDFIGDSKRATFNIDKIRINGKPVKTKIVKLTSSETMLISEFPIWASSDNDMGVYKNKIIDEAYDNYCKDIFELINLHITNITSVFIIILGKADSHYIGDRVYDQLIDNNKTITYNCENIEDTCKINDTTFFYNSWDIYSDTIEYKKNINDNDLAYLRAYNFLSRYNAVNNNKITTESKIYIYDYPDSLKNYSSLYRQVNVYMIISNLVFNKEDLERYNRATMMDVCNANKGNLIILFEENPDKPNESIRGAIPQHKPYK